MPTRAEFEKELREILKRNHEAFIGQYADQINQLLGLSREEINSITPNTTELETYDQLIAVVKDASRRNVSQAELKKHIENLGATAVSIAKKVTSLAGLFA